MSVSAHILKDFMHYNSREIVRCTEPTCIKCHCNECEYVREACPKFVISWSSKGAAFIWVFVDKVSSLQVTLELE